MRSSLPAPLSVAARATLFLQTPGMAFISAGGHRVSRQNWIVGRTQVLALGRALATSHVNRETACRFSGRTFSDSPLVAPLAPLDRPAGATPIVGSRVLWEHNYGLGLGLPASSPFHPKVAPAGLPHAFASPPPPRPAGDWQNTTQIQTYPFTNWFEKDSRIIKKHINIFV